MGRPINKKHIGDGQGKIQVTAVRFASGGELTTDSHIVEQRSSKKFRVKNGSTTEICTLVNKSIGALGASEFIINVTDTAGATKQITKLYNRKMQLEGNSRAKWSRDADGKSTAIEKTITNATKANPVVITSANHGFSNGDKISIRGVLGMVELNTETGYTVAGAQTNSFQLAGINGTGFTTHTGNAGVATKAGSSGIIVDAQAS